MFICGQCHKPIGPKLKPILITLHTRPMEYHNIKIVVDEFDVERKIPVDSAGYETIKEMAVCADCANEVIDPPAIQIIGGKTFEELQQPALKIKFIASAIASMLDRIEHKSKRAKTEINTVIPAIKQFVDDHKQFVF